MKVEDFLKQQTEEARQVFETLDGLIQAHDARVSVEVGSIMRVKEALVYKEEGVFKYGLTATKNHFSYHSMIMYAFPEVLADFKKANKGIKFQKGCFNFYTAKSLHLPSLTRFLALSANMDFGPVIRHYQSR